MLEVSTKGKLRFPGNEYMFKVNCRNNKKGAKICSKVIIKTPDQRHWRHSGISTVNFEHISYLFSRVSTVNFDQGRCLLGYYEKTKVASSAFLPSCLPKNAQEEYISIIKVWQIWWKLLIIIHFTLIYSKL